jgi:hypothetical protein
VLGECVSSTSRLDGGPQDWRSEFYHTATRKTQTGNSFDVRIDFVGVNVYQPTFVHPDVSEAGYAIVPAPSSYPHMFSPWLTIAPEALLGPLD